MTPADLEELAKKKAKEEAEKNPEKEGTSPWEAEEVTVEKIQMGMVFLLASF